MKVAQAFLPGRGFFSILMNAVLRVKPVSAVEQGRSE